MLPFHEIKNNLVVQFRDWRSVNDALHRLGSEEDAERDAAIRWFLIQGERRRAVLRRALRRAPAISCGAAITLDNMGEPAAVRFVLRRAYEEEWLSIRVHPDYPDVMRGLRWLNLNTLQNEFERGLHAAECTTDLSAALNALTLALSAFRVINLNTDAPLETLQRGLHFGHGNLRRLQHNHALVLALNLANAVRMEALNGLLKRSHRHSLPLLADALHSPDLSVVRIAITGLRRVNDRRAVAWLHNIAFGGGHPLAEQARNAIARLLGTEADALTLLRASQNEITGDELLRPAAPSHADAADTLLRSVVRREA